MLPFGLFTKKQQKKKLLIIQNNHSAMVQLNLTFMQLNPLLLVLALCCIACNNDKAKKTGSDTSTAIKFDTAKWRIKNGDDYPYRDELLKYLTTNNKLKAGKKIPLWPFLANPIRLTATICFIE